MKSKEIRLSEEEQISLKNIVKSGVQPAKESTGARVLLMLDRTEKTDHVRYNRTAECVCISVQEPHDLLFYRFFTIASLDL